DAQHAIAAENTLEGQDPVPLPYVGDFSVEQRQTASSPGKKRSPLRERRFGVELLKIDGTGCMGVANRKPRRWRSREPGVFLAGIPWHRRPPAVATPKHRPICDPEGIPQFLVGQFSVGQTKLVALVEADGARQRADESHDEPAPCRAVRTR